jgi:hypothetical protein
MPNLTNSTTSILKATHVPLLVTEPVPSDGRAVVKSSYVRQLNLQTGEVDAAAAVLKNQAKNPTTNAHSNSTGMLTLLRQFESPQLASQLPSPSALVNIAHADLADFGQALLSVRQQAVKQINATGAQAPNALNSLSVKATIAPLSLGWAMNQLNTGVVAVNQFGANIAATPMGMLNLERLEMTPAGIERGGLIATIPLAPKERTSVVQKEWSVTSQEFTSIVSDSLENYSETGVTENTQLTQATASQVSHANQFNINDSVSGSIGFVTASVASEFSTQDQTSQSASQSRNHAIQTTKKASSRVKQSHKVTISTSTVTGSSESTTRLLENPSATDPIRIDYFSLMRKWYVALYRYGLRLTYDITVPEPAAAMRAAYEMLRQLQDQVAQGFSFPVAYSEITEEVRAGETDPHYLVLAQRYAAQVPPPSDAFKVRAVSVTIPNLGGDNNDNMIFNLLQIAVDDNYEVDDMTMEVDLSNSAIDRAIHLSGYGAIAVPAGQFSTTIDLTAATGFMSGYQGAQTLSYWITDVGAGTISYTMKLKWSDEARVQWQVNVWNALYNASQTSYYAQQQVVTAQIQTLQDKINNVDTLTLRREENDEIMKSVLRWLLGPGFEFMPTEVINLFASSAGAPGSQARLNALIYGVNFTGDSLPNSGLNWNLMYANEDRINFINQAIDWDNVLYYLYSYFWDEPLSWDFIRQIQHPDSTRQAFLRSGSARVVLTVRPGWEVAWTNFVEYFSTELPDDLPSHPYLTIAQQIQDYDSTNYPGIPPANPNGGGPIDDGSAQVGTVCASALPASSSPVIIPVADSTGFVAGESAILDTWGSGVQETQTITAVPDGTHITVQAVSNAHTLINQAPFPIVQAGSKGTLIGEWFEYTPSSGTDIAVTSNLATIG